ncbi:MAG TPA: hypothetical protein VJN18_01155 [Polyangiaceae bacterium]|nr:hypothetical protein [Polyangiaceae bacterium]
MSKRLSATLTRAHEPGQGSNAVSHETEVSQHTVRPSALPLGSLRTRRGLVPHRLRSNLGEPVGVFSWEREFLLALAVDVLEDFVERDHEEGK